MKKAVFPLLLLALPLPAARTGRPPEATGSATASALPETDTLEPIRAIGEASRPKARETAPQRVPIPQGAEDSRVKAKLGCFQSPASEELCEAGFQFQLLPAPFENNYALSPSAELYFKGCGEPFSAAAQRLAWPDELAQKLDEGYCAWEAGIAGGETIKLSNVHWHTLAGKARLPRAGSPGGRGGPKPARAAHGRDRMPAARGRPPR
ncbi:MAG: hypothetical protein LBD02_04515 [Christensenellaceae bacterium]|nr:hypothetical protein [Christensenellaceae bacterium]